MRSKSFCKIEYTDSEFRSYINDIQWNLICTHLCFDWFFYLQSTVEGLTMEVCKIILQIKFIFNVSPWFSLFLNISIILVNNLWVNSENVQNNHFHCSSMFLFPESVLSLVFFLKKKTAHVVLPSKWRGPKLCLSLPEIPTTEDTCTWRYCSLLSIVLYLNTFRELLQN